MRVLNRRDPGKCRVTCNGDQTEVPPRSAPHTLSGVRPSRMNRMVERKKGPYGIQTPLLIGVFCAPSEHGVSTVRVHSDALRGSSRSIRSPEVSSDQRLAMSE